MNLFHIPIIKSMNQKYYSDVGVVMHYVSINLL